MTILGHHTVAELRDWLAAVDYQANQIAGSFKSFAPTWSAHDGATARDWSSDWSAFLSRYRTARARALLVIGRAQVELGIPDSVIPVEDEWQGVQNALARTPGSIAKGDFQDLYNRLSAAQAKPIDMSATPQPTAVDADLGAYKAADAVIRAGENVARTVAPSKSTGVMVLLGVGLGFGLLVALRSVLK